MWRYLAGAAACFLTMTGVFLVWQSQAEGSEQVPRPPKSSSPAILAGSAPDAPEASAKSREEKRFDRSDKNKDGRIALQELIEPRKKAFAKLDKNGDGKLAFEEWAASTIDKFNGADADRNGSLTRTEFATTAPPPPKRKPRCGC